MLQIKVQEADTTEASIEATRCLYIPVAKRAQILFFCLADLALIEPMYQYSLEWFIGIFINSMINTEKSGELFYFYFSLILYIKYPLRSVSNFIYKYSCSTCSIL